MYGLSSIEEEKERENGMAGWEERGGTEEAMEGQVRGAGGVCFASCIESIVVAGRR